jgi:hypothetical protein
MPGLLPLGVSYYGYQLDSGFLDRHRPRTAFR